MKKNKKRRPLSEENRMEAERLRQTIAEARKTMETIKKVKSSQYLE